MSELQFIRGSKNVICTLERYQKGLAQSTLDKTNIPLGEMEGIGRAATILAEKI